MADTVLAQTGSEVQQDIEEGLNNQPKENYVWDDWSFSTSNLKVSPVTSKPDYDQTEDEYLFDDSINETVIGSGITSHKLKLGVSGMTWRPHIHWMQEGSGRVLWQLRYKITPAGETEGSWITIQSTTDEFTYTSGSLHQITIFPYVDASTFTSTAFQVKVEITRLASNVLDTYVGDARFMAFDIHIPLDQLGSRQEFIK